MTSTVSLTPKLNFDILAMVYPFLLYNENSSLMKTCRTLYKAGIPFLLAHFPPNRWSRVISSSHALASFCMFMLAESFSDLRFHTFRDLTLDFSEDGIEVKSHDILINQLGRVLRKAIRLERLEIWEPEKYFEFSPETHGILANLPMLTSLELSGVGEISLEVLKTVVSPIRSLNVGDTGEEREWLQVLPPLPSVAATLAELSLAFINISPNQVVYPHVRSISFEHLLAPDMPAFFVAFPNLSNLHISSEDYPLEAWEAVGHRKARRNIINSLPSQWASLKCLSGDLVFLYLIGLTCRVDQLLVTVVDIESLPWFLELLDDHHPKSIFVRLDCNKLTMTSLEDTILRPMFDRPSVSRCRSLHLDLSGLSDYNASPDAFPEISDIVDRIAISLASLSLQALILVLERFPLRMRPALEALDLHSFASNLRGDLPSLQYVEVRTGNASAALKAVPISEMSR